MKDFCMAAVLKLSEKLVNDAKASATVEHRSVSEQIEYWARIGKFALENPDMPRHMIQDTMRSLGESKAGFAAPYLFG